MGELSVRDFAWLELWVGSARQSALFFADALGFSIVAYAGPRTGVPDRASYLVEQGGIRLVLTGAVRPDSPVADYVRAHGDGVRDIAFAVDEGRAREPMRTFGDATHTFVERSGSVAPLAPGYEAMEWSGRSGPPAHLTRIDHLAISVEEGSREQWVGRYETLGFERVRGHDEHIDIGASAFDMSTVRAIDGSAMLVFAEPAPGPQKSQIAYYLEHFGGAGVHHVAFSTDDIVRSVSSLHERGLRTLGVPPTYYRETRARLGDLGTDWGQLERLGILVDRDQDGHLFQTFTEPLGDRPTLYLEIIQREGTTGFGTENVRALYHAVVRDQQMARAGASTL